MNASETKEIPDFSKFKYAWYRSGRYAVNVKSYLTLGNGKANETETEEIWEITPGEYGHLDVTVSEKKYLRFDAQMKPFYEIIDQVNKATQHLKLLLNEDKSIASVENTGEITEKWEEIKRKELRFLQLVRDSYNEIIHIYDKEFSRIDDNIKANLLYQIIFPPFPGTGINFKLNDSLKNREFLSTLFPGEKICYTSDYQFLESTEDFKMKMTGKFLGNTGSFTEIYAQNYLKTLQIPLDYGLIMDGEYVYNQDSVLSEIVFQIKEQMNEKMLYVCRYHIQLIL